MNREELVFLATIAEKAERYEEMAEYMSKVVTISNGELTGNERELFSTAFKNIMGSRLAAKRVLTGIESAEKNDPVRFPLVVDYRAKVVGEIAYFSCVLIKVVSALLASPTKDNSDFLVTMTQEGFDYMSEEVADQKPPSLLFLEVDFIGREQYPYLANLADKSGRHQEMALIMENLVLRAYNSNFQLTPEERKLLKLSFKKACLSLRDQWIKVRYNEHQQYMLNNHRSMLLIRDLRIKIEKEIGSLSLTILNLLDLYLIPMSVFSAAKKPYLKMKLYFEEFLPRNLPKHKPQGHGVVLHWVLNSGIHKLGWIKSQIGPLFSLSEIKFRKSVTETGKALLTRAKTEIEKCGSIHGFMCAFDKLIEVFNKLHKNKILLRRERRRAIPKYTLKFRIGKKLIRIGGSRSKKRYFAVAEQVKWVAQLVDHSRNFCKTLPSISIADMADCEAAGRLFVSGWFTGSLIIDSSLEQDLAAEQVKRLLSDARIPANKIVIPDGLRLKISRNGKRVKKC